jgi:hypothetical protein
VNHALLPTLPGITRRGFALSFCAPPLASLAAEPHPVRGPWDEPAVVAKVYITAPTIHLPHPAADMAKEHAEVEGMLKDFGRQHPEIRFTGGEVLKTPADIAPWAKSLGEADALLIVPLSTPAVNITPVIDAAKLPTLLFSRPHAGHQWAQVASLRGTGRRVDVVAAGSVDALAGWVPVFRSIRHMRRSKVLIAAANRTGGYFNFAPEYAKHFGTTIQWMTIEELRDAFEAADPRQAEREAAEFTRAALRVAEPKQAEIQGAMRFYIGFRKLLERERANAITVDCFPAILGKKLPAYPCIAWSKLNDAGLYGVCQADVRATMTQLLVTSYARVPGFVSNPVFDMERNEVIHSHCVGATRMLGFQGPSSPYIVRSHTETDEGAVLQVVMPSGHPATVGIFSDPKRFLVSRADVVSSVGEISGHRDADTGCRTKIRTRVADAEKWMASYSTAVHRVVFYGDHIKGIERIGRLLAFETVREA